MKNEYKEILKMYQCEFNRQLEETFSSVLCEKNDIRLFFINENQAFTDGKNIVVDPANDEMFCDEQAMHDTENFLKLSHTISKDSYLALRMVTRSQNIHEALHIIYSDFPSGVCSDTRGTNKIRKNVLAKIYNIIEDAFVESAGASEFDNMAMYLMWGRVSRLYSNTPSEGTIQQTFKENPANIDIINARKQTLLMEYLNYFIVLLLYPMIEPSAVSREIQPYIKLTKQLFLDASICGDPKERYSFTPEIFDLIIPLIPEIDEFDGGNFEQLFATLLGGCKTHKGESVSINEHSHSGKIAVINQRLFTNLDGKFTNNFNLNDQYVHISNIFQIDKEAALKIVTVVGKTWDYNGDDIISSALHKNIRVKVQRPKPNLNLKKAYDNIYNNYKLNINSYNARFAQILKGLVDVKEDKFMFGGGIASKRLGDTKKRFWFRNIQGVDVPDVAILFLVDGSGSMDGDRRNSAMISSVILHEVLTKNGVEHAIVEHRAKHGAAEININILMDFSPQINEKYNIMQLDADGNSRDGLALYWAEKYLMENSSAQHKVMVVLSDGIPFHISNDDIVYAPPVSVKDTANAVTKVLKHGVDIIAIAIDDENDSCYEELKEIYPTIVSCKDLKHLTGQILTIVSKLFT